MLEQFELPLPIIKCSVEKIVVETQEKYEGSFQLSNTGGGELEGNITSNSKLISFSPEQFRGNKVDINFVIDISIYKIGDVVQTSALIVSNGGELVLPISVSIMPPAIITKDNEKISSLKEFLWYAKMQSVAARQLFTQTDFMMWLFSMNYEHMELYDHFVSDPNKERAVDNFLVLNKLKRKSKITEVQKNITVDIPSYSKEITTGIIQFKRSGWGYIESDLIIEPSYPWFTLFKTKITAQDFDEEGNCNIDYFINPTKLFLKRESISIRVVTEGEDDIVIKITAFVRPPYSAKLNKNSFVYDDNGYILIENHKGGEMVAEIHTDCPHIKFEGRRYHIRDHAQIPFSVKVGAFASAQNFLSRQNIIKGKIYITVDRRLFVLGMGAKLQSELDLIIAKPIADN